MKSALMTAFLTALFTLPASAGSLLLDMRTDYDAASFNGAAKAAGQSDQSSFLLHTARADLKGDLSENLSFRLRFRFNNESTTQGPDSLATRIDFASVTHRLGAVALTFGKTTTDVGGHETIADSREVYLKSEANKALTGTYNALSAAAPGFYQVKYDTGVKAQLGLGQSDLILMAMNNPEAESAGAPRPHNRLLQGAVWKGKFAENTLQPVLSYHTFKSNLDNASSDSDTETKLMAAGFKWIEAGSFAQLDYVQLKAGPLALGTASDLEINSLVLEGGYKMGDWTPRLKAELSKVAEKPDTGAKIERDITGYGLALEYRVPEADLARYHLALTQKTAKQDNVADRTETHLIAGFVFAYDLLK